MTEEQFTKATQEAFNPSELVVCSVWNGFIDVDCNLFSDINFQVAADREDGDTLLVASTLYDEVKLLENEDIDKFLGILFAKISEEHGYEKALEWANSINLETLYEWFQTARDIFKGRIKMSQSWD